MAATLETFRWIEREPWYYGAVNGFLVKYSPRPNRIWDHCSSAGGPWPKNGRQASKASHTSAWETAWTSLPDGTEATARGGPLPCLRWPTLYRAMPDFAPGPPGSAWSPTFVARTDNIDRIAAIVDLLTDCYGDPLTRDWRDVPYLHQSGQPVLPRPPRVALDIRRRLALCCQRSRAFTRWPGAPS